MGNDFIVEYADFIIRGLVNYPDAVLVERTQDEMGVLLRVKVDPSDMGLVIGKEGVTAKAIRTLVRMVGMKNRAKVSFQLVEPEGRPPRPQRTYTPAPAGDQTGPGKSIDNALSGL